MREILRVRSIEIGDALLIERWRLPKIRFVALRDERRLHLVLHFLNAVVDLDLLAFYINDLLNRAHGVATSQVGGLDRFDVLQVDVNWRIGQ